MKPKDESQMPVSPPALAGDAAAPPVAAARAGRARWPVLGLEVVALVAVLLLAAWLRVAYADEFGTYDELWNLALTTGHGTPFGQYGTDVINFHPRLQTSLADKLPAWKCWTTLDYILHPPLYILTLRFWRDAFGEGDAAARAYSNLWSLVAILFSFLTVRATMGRVLGLLAALALAMAPTQVYFGQEMRSYSMLIAIGCVGLWLMTRIEKLGPSRRRAVALALVPFALLMVHYFAFGAALAIAAFGFWRLVGHRRTFAVTLATTAVVYAAIWLPFALRQLKAIDTGDSFLHVPYRDWSREFQFFIAGPIRQLIDRPLNRDRTLLFTGLAFVVPWLVARRLPALRPWTLWLCATLFGLLLLDVARQSEHLAYVRYTAAASPAVVPVLIGTAWAIRRWAGYAVAVLLVLASGVYLNANVGVAADSPGFGHVARAVARRAGPGEAIITYHGDGPFWSGRVIQLHLSHEPGFFPRPIIDLSKPMPRELEDQLPRRSWLIALAYRGPIEAVVPGARVVSARSVDDGIDLYELALPPLAAPTTASTSPASP